MAHVYEMAMMVRDYECDLQGVVNNSVYQNYLEHTRHEFLEHMGVSFAELFEKGIMNRCFLIMVRRQHH